MVDDEKLRIIAFEDRWHFVAILCCKAQGILNSDPKLARRKVAVKLGLSFGELDEVARRLAEVGLIDQKTLEPLAWDKRQFVSDKDSSARDRQRRRREKLKESKDSDCVTDVSRVTSPLRHGRVTRPEADTEADTYTETEERERDTPPATRSALPAVKPSRLPDWIDPAAWEGFVAMRKKIRAPLTERAITVTINELERLRSAGQNPNHCLDQSTQHAWRGVFAVKTGDNHAGQRQHRETPLQASLREAEEILQRARDGTLGPEWDFSDNGDDVFGSVHPPERALPAQGGGGVPGEAAGRITNT